MEEVISCLGIRYIGMDWRKSHENETEGGEMERKKRRKGRRSLHHPTSEHPNPNPKTKTKTTGRATGEKTRFKKTGRLTNYPMNPMYIFTLNPNLSDVVFPLCSCSFLICLF